MGALCTCFTSNNGSQSMPSNGQEVGRRIVPAQKGQTSGSSGNDDFGSNSSMEIKPLHFPQEVWEIILNKLTDEKDRTNCCRAYPWMDKILTKSKYVWQFNDVLPLLAKHLEEKDMLTCRRVCKQWREDIDSLMYPQNAFSSDTANGLNMERHYFFDSVDKMDRFILTFAGHLANPFNGRSVSVYNRNFNKSDAEVFQRKFLELLINFGREIWTLKCNFYINCTTLDIYTYLAFILVTTPNLKQLGLDKNCWWEVGALRNPELSLYMTENLLRDIPSLQVFSVRVDTVLPEAFTNMLLSPYASHLETIHIHWANLALVFRHPLPKLRHLEVFGIQDDQGLEQLLRVNAPLRTIRIEAPHLLRCSISIVVLLRVLNNFPLLEKVIVEGLAKTWVDGKCFVNATVRDLELEVHDMGLPSTPVSFNFLRAFRVLEVLNLKLCFSTGTFLGRKEKEEDVQIYKTFGKGGVYSSNIWRLIPSLKTLRILYKNQVVVGNRKMYDRYRSRVRYCWFNKSWITGS